MVYGSKYRQRNFIAHYKQKEEKCLYDFFYHKLLVTLKIKFIM